MSNRVAKRKSGKWVLFVRVKHSQEAARDQDAERSTLTTPMMHLAKTAGSLGGCFVRPSGQRGTTQSALQYDVDQQRVSRWVMTSETQRQGARSRASREELNHAILYCFLQGREAQSLYLKTCSFYTPKIRMLSRPWRNGVTRSAQNTKAVFLPLICGHKRR